MVRATHERVGVAVMDPFQLMPRTSRGKEEIMLNLVILFACASAGPAQEPAVQPAGGGSAQEYVDAGLAAFRRRRMSQAMDQFQKALSADPSSAAANFYLGYTLYKMTEAKRPFHPDKQRSASLFGQAFQLDPNFTPVWGGKKK